MEKRRNFVLIVEQKWRECSLTREELIDYLYPINTVYFGRTPPDHGLWIEIDKFTWRRMK